MGSQVGQLIKGFLVFSGYLLRRHRNELIILWHDVYGVFMRATFYLLWGVYHSGGYSRVDGLLDEVFGTGRVMHRERKTQFSSIIYEFCVSIQDGAGTVMTQVRLYDLA